MKTDDTATDALVAAIVAVFIKYAQCLGEKHIKFVFSQIQKVVYGLYQRPIK